VANRGIIRVTTSAASTLSVIGTIAQYVSFSDYLAAYNFGFIDVSGVFTPTGGGAPVNNRGAIGTGQLTVTTAGTPVNGPSIAIPNGFALIVRALKSNTKNVSYSDTSAHAKYTGFTGNGPEVLGPDDVDNLYITNVNLLWLDSQVNGEGIAWSVEQ